MHDKDVSMDVVGDGQEGQPTEGVTSLDSLVGLMDGGDEGAGAPGESEESDGSELPEGSGEGEEEGEEGEEGSEEQEDDPTLVLKHDGKELTFKQSEVIGLAQQGLDYTKKTMALAEERKGLESERSKASEYRQEVEHARQVQLNQLQALEQF